MFLQKIYKNLLKWHHYSFAVILFCLIFKFSSIDGVSQVTSFPHSVSFESSSDLGTSASDANSKWTTGTSGDWSASEVLWVRNSGGTVSSSTGPSNGYPSSGYYIYVETSSPSVSGDDAELMCKYDFSGRQNASINFKYHNYGSGSEGPADMALYVYDVAAAS